MRVGLTILLTFLFMLSGMPHVVDESAGDTVSIAPGDMYNYGCTLNFVYDGVEEAAGRVFMGTAAHCTQVGHTASTQVVQKFGRTVYANDTTDVALIEVYPEFYSMIDPSVRGRPGLPKDVMSLEDATVGDVILISGQAQIINYFQVARENRVGVFAFNPGDGMFGAFGPISFGDSGGPVLHKDSMSALGSIYEITVPHQVHGPTVELAMQSGAAAGYPIQLRTAS